MKNIKALKHGGKGQIKVTGYWLLVTGYWLLVTSEETSSKNDSNNSSEIETLLILLQSLRGAERRGNLGVGVDEIIIPMSRGNIINLKFSVFSVTLWFCEKQ